MADARKTKTRRAGRGATAKARPAAPEVKRINLALQEFDVLVKSNDIEMIKRVKTLRPEARTWLMRVYTSLGQMHADSGQYQEARLWINQALKIDPNNELARTLKLEITRALLRKKNP